MLADLDETLRQFLIRYAPLETSDVDVSFETPDRDWSSRLSRPTVNCFLYDVRENHDLRQTGWDVARENGSYVRKKEPIRLDATYQVSVWAQGAEDEHRLLWHVLATLARHPTIPEDVFAGEVREQPLSLPTRVAQPDEGPRNMAELWQGIDNRVRPTITYIVTVALDPNVSATGPLVLRRSTTMLQLPQADPAPAPVYPAALPLPPAQGDQEAGMSQEPQAAPAARATSVTRTRGIAHTQENRGNGSRPRPAN